MRGRRDAKNIDTNPQIQYFPIFQNFKHPQYFDGKVIQKFWKKIIEPRTPVEMSDFFVDGTKSWLDILRKRAETNEIALNQLPP